MGGREGGRESAWSALRQRSDQHTLAIDARMEGQGQGITYTRTSSRRPIPTCAIDVVSVCRSRHLVLIASRAAASCRPSSHSPHIDVHIRSRPKERRGRARARGRASVLASCGPASTMTNTPRRLQSTRIGYCCSCWLIGLNTVLSCWCVWVELHSNSSGANGRRAASHCSQLRILVCQWWCVCAPRRLLHRMSRACCVRDVCVACLCVARPAVCRFTAPSSRRRPASAASCAAPACRCT